MVGGHYRVYTVQRKNGTFAVQLFFAKFFLHDKRYHTGTEVSKFEAKKLSDTPCPILKKCR